MKTNPRTERLDLPKGEHGEHGSTGAAWVREQRRRLGVLRGSTNPYKKELQHAEKQLRKRHRDGARVDEIIAAQLKVENFKELHDTWQRRGDQ